MSMKCQECTSPCTAPEHACVPPAVRVLFVEDCEDDVLLMLDVLADYLGRIEHARVDTAAALRNAMETPYAWDVVISDHNMPALDAPTALSIARAAGNDTPFIIVSGSMTEDEAVACMKAGAADMIGKDRLARLAPAVERELQNSLGLSKLRHAREQIERMACFDDMTGLPKRDFLVKKLVARTNIVPIMPQCVVVLNIRRYSFIARTLGFALGEEVLQQFAHRLQESVGTRGSVASLGGDRFAMLLDEPAMPVIDGVRDALRWPYNAGGQDLFVGVRMGASVFPRDGSDFTELLSKAEIAMNQVKPGVRPDFHFFEEGMQDIGRMRWAMEQSLHGALQRNEFSLHYQPQVDARSGRIVGAEALLRWTRPGRAPVSPAEFIPLLEETGLIVPVGEWVLRTACLQYRAWREAGAAPMRLAVNLSALQFREPGLVDMVDRVLRDTGMEARDLELEITENIAMNNEEIVIEALARLRALGVHLAIDDFGTGYSSLSYLQRFPVQRVKIDQSFVQEIQDIAPHSQIVTAIISLARNLGLAVIAEGVETEAQMAFLGSSGCSEMQGYLFNRPMPAAQMLALLVPGATPLD